MYSILVACTVNGASNTAIAPKASGPECRLTPPVKAYSITIIFTGTHEDTFMGIASAIREGSLAREQSVSVQQARREQERERGWMKPCPRGRGRSWMRSARTV
jgi:hypothetical protein